MKHYIHDLDFNKRSRDQIDIRRQELKKQNWNREKSSELAIKEGIQLTDEHWEVIKYLRSLYLCEGMPRHASILSKDLTLRFSGKGGIRYLYKLFKGGPVKQGCLIANLNAPSCTINKSIKTCF